MAAIAFEYTTPWGQITGLAADAGIRSLRLPGWREGPPPTSAIQAGPPPDALRQGLDQYFTGEAVSFDDIPVDVSTGAGFNAAVWLAARGIPWGQTATYGEIAQRLGLDMGSARAVGRALGANPLALLVPCHRVIAQDGGLVNFAAGLEWKRRLLQLEGSLML